MPKYELSIVPDYVPSWTVVDAVREFFQNAIDQQNTVEGNDMFFHYDAETQVLTIGNKKSMLEAKSLLLGASTKARDNATIGQFGEGYKIASLVLVRNGKKVTFYNYGAREVWRPRFSRSQKYKTTILVFDVDRKYIWNSVPDNDLTITIEGITPEEYEQIVESNLHLQDVYNNPSEYVETEYGKILLNPKYASKVYVHGLFVCQNVNLTYGYDFKPEYLQLGRDRSLVNDFDLFWLTSKTWQDSGRSSEIIELAKKDAADVKYVSQVSFFNMSSYNDICETAYSEFRRIYGTKAVPVVSQEEADVTESMGYRPVVVTEVHKKLIESAPDFVPPRIESVPFESLIEDFVRKNFSQLSDESLQKLFIIAPKQVNAVLAERGENPMNLSSEQMREIIDQIHSKEYA